MPKIMRSKHKEGILKGHLFTTQPFQDISIDIYGPIPYNLFKGNEIITNKFSILTITDRCTRWTEIYKIKNILTDDALNNIKKWIKTYGYPKTILCDNGTQFRNKIINKFLLSKEIQNIFTSPCNPTGNAISERINQKITDIIRKNKGETLKLVIDKLISH